MLLELKKIFLNENESLSVHTEPDMTDCNFGENSFSDKVSADITITNHAGLVELDALVRFNYRFRCDRCYDPFNRDFAFKFHHILVTSPAEDNSDDYIEAPDYTLDTDILLRDDILLELPSKLLCKDSCKGLCPKCGKNLNNGNCACSLREVDPRFAALNKLLEE